MSRVPRDDSSGVVVPIDPDLAPSDPAAPRVDHRPPRRRTRRAQSGVLLAIAAGGALGAPARYEVSLLIRMAKGSFPWSTFWTNVSGSFVLGFLLVLLIERFPPSRYLRPFLATGFLGAFTTFSTLSVETDLLIKDGHAVIGMIYAIASLLAGFAAVWAGIVLARIVPRRQATS